MAIATMSALVVILYAVFRRKGNSAAHLHRASRSADTKKVDQ